MSYRYFWIPYIELDWGKFDIIFWKARKRFALPIRKLIGSKSFSAPIIEQLRNLLVAERPDERYDGVGGPRDDKKQADADRSLGDADFCWRRRIYPSP